VFGNSLRIAWRSLMARKFRTLLTVVGMVIGLSGVIAIISMGEGMKSAFTSEFASYGSNWMYIFPQAVQRGGQAWGSGRVEQFSVDDVSAIRRRAEHVEFVLPGTYTGLKAKHANKTYNLSVLGTTWEYFYGPGVEVENGRGFNEREENSISRVTVIGAEVRERLFADFQDPVGEVIKLGAENFTVVGVLKRKGSGFGGSEDEMALIPLSTMQQRILGSDDINYIIAIASDLSVMDEAKDEVTQVLRQRRRIKDPTKQDFEVMTLTDTLEFANRFFNILIMVFGFMAVIALLVSGINIMNIMLVTVTVRMREVGLRIALGAGRRSVLMQFLIEAALMTLVGGLLGILAGWGLGLIVGMALSNWMGVGWMAVVPPGYALLALAVSVTIGLIFGIYPASRASRLDPVVAMRKD
jgi:putative ABC transport system permease protein